MQKLTFHVEVRSPRLVEVRWDHDFGRHGLPIYHAMSNDFDAVHGVEKVVMGRYSANVIIADHVAGAKDVVEGLVAAIRDQNISTAFRLFASDLEVQIDVFLAPTLRI